MAGPSQADITNAVNQTQINGLGPALNVGGDISGIAGLVTNPSNPVSDIKGLGALGNVYNAVTGGTGSLSGGISAVTPYLGLAGAAAGMALSDYQLLDPANTPDVAKYTLPGETTAKLPSGNAIDELGGVGIGLGTQETQGSGEIYKTNGTTPSWIGQQYSGELENDASQLAVAAAGPQTQAQYDLANAIKAGSTTTATPFGSSISTTSGPTTIEGGANTSKPMTQAQLNAMATSAQTNMSSIFNATGGAAGWGVSESEWMNSMAALLGSIQPGTQWART